MTEEGREFAPNNAANKERWIFVNGMCLDNNLGGTNAIQLAKLFKRQVMCIISISASVNILPDRVLS